MDHIICIRMPDKSVWAVPHKPLAEIVADRQIERGAWEKNISKEEVVEELLEASIIDVAVDQLLEWLDWPDIVPHALMVKPPAPTYEEWWKKWDEEQRIIDHWQDLWFMGKEDEQYLTTHGFFVTHKPDGSLTISKTTERKAEG